MNKNYINIILTADNNYTKVIGITMTSILENLDRTTTARFYIFSYKFSCKDIDELNKLKIKYNCEIVNIPMEAHIHKFDFINEKDFKNKWISIACYFRLLLFDILPDEVCDCFYVDGDMIIDCDLRQIKLTDDKMFLACPEIQAMQHRKNILSHCYNLPEFERFQQNAISNPYFNAGFFLVNLQMAKEYNIYDQIMNLLKKYPKLPYCDQDLLNIIFGQKYRNKIEFLTPEYNVFTVINYNIDYSDTPFSTEVIKKAFKYPKIIHYAGAQKPWNTYKEIHHENIWWKYYKKSPWGKNYILKRTQIWFSSKNGFLKIFRKIFSIVNEGKHKVITVLGLKIKYRRKEN